MLTILYPIVAQNVIQSDYHKKTSAENCDWNFFKFSVNYDKEI
jgi:hypothetical protein